MRRSCDLLSLFVDTGNAIMNSGRAKTETREIKEFRYLITVL